MGSNCFTQHLQFFIRHIRIDNFIDVIIVMNLTKRPLTIDSDSSENNVEPQPKKPSEPIVMTLDLSSNGKWRLNSSTD